MEKAKRFIFILSLSVIAFWIVGSFIALFIPWEFASSRLEFKIETLRFYSLPIAILFTLFGTLNKNDNIGEIIAKIFGTLVVAGIAGLFIIMMAFANMCDFYNKREIYVSIENPNKVIVIRDYGCGATDSSQPSIHVQKRVPITPLFYQYTDFDTLTMDKSQWIKTVSKPK